jgi:hypothetical protein
VTNTGLVKGPVALITGVCHSGQLGLDVIVHVADLVLDKQEVMEIVSQHLRPLAAKANCLTCAHCPEAETQE